MNCKFLSMARYLKSSSLILPKKTASIPIYAKRPARAAEWPKGSNCHAILGLIPNSLMIQS